MTTLMHARELGFDPTQLYLTLFPTEKCNLRCSYCYERFPNKRFSPEMIASIKRLLLTRADDLSYLLIAWFGGEPLLEQATIAEVSSFALSLAQKAGFTYESTMTTNAVLLDAAVFRVMLNSGVRRFQISFDGYGAEHDRTRRSPAGKGTFNELYSNLLAMRASKETFEIHFRLHVHMENLESVKRLTWALRKDVGSDRRFFYSVETIRNWGGSSVKNLKLVKREDIRDEINAILAELPAGQVKRPTGTEFCLAALPNHFIIRADGGIQKCTVALYDERNNVGRLGHDGKLMLNVDRVRAWSEGLFSGEVEKIVCPWASATRVRADRVEES